MDISLFSISLLMVQKLRSRMTTKGVNILLNSTPEKKDVNCNTQFLYIYSLLTILISKQYRICERRPVRRK